MNISLDLHPFYQNLSTKINYLVTKILFTKIKIFFYKNHRACVLVLRGIFALRAHCALPLN